MCFDFVCGTFRTCSEGLKEKNVEHVRHLESAFSVCWAALYLSVSWLQTIFIQQKGSQFQFGVQVAASVAQDFTLVSYWIRLIVVNEHSFGLGVIVIAPEYPLKSNQRIDGFTLLSTAGRQVRKTEPGKEQIKSCQHWHQFYIRAWGLGLRVGFR